METKCCYGCMQEKEGTPFCEHCGYDERIPNGAHQLPKGTVLRGQYLIGKVLGQGGFGITYLGKDLTLDIPVAIKEYYPTGVVTRESTYSHTLSVATGAEDTRFEENRDRFLREARTLAKLQDVPEVVQIKNFFPENNTAYIIMGYVNGITLKEYLSRRGGKLSAQETFQLLQPLLRALDRVHKAGLVHRDISPDNIMITPEGQVRLIDFGAAHAATNAGDKSTQAVLKHGFAPPEQYQRKGQLGPWTDVYAICATIYNCLTGLTPPTATDRFVGEEDFTWDSIPGLTAQQREALSRGVALQYAQRTQTMEAFCSQLFAEEAPSPVFHSAVPEVSAVGTIALGREESPTFTPVQAPVHTAPVQHSAYTAPVHEPIHTAPVHTSPAVPVQPGTPKKKSPLVPIIAAVLAVLVALGAVLFFLKPGTDGEEARVDRSERESSSGKKPAADAPEADAPVAEAPAADAIAGPLPAESFTLRVWGSSDAINSGFLSDACYAFANAHPEWGIDFTFEVCEVGDASTRVTRAPAAAADVYMFTNDQLETLLQANAIAPLEGSVLDQVMYDNSETMVASVSSFGRVYGVPFSGNTWFMYYAKSVYTEEDIKSLDAMMAKKPVGFEVTNTWYLPAFYFAAGGTMFGPEGKDGAAGINFGGENGAAATLYVANALAAGTMIDGGSGIGLDAMRSGEIGAMFSGYWEAANYMAALGKNFGVAQLPCITLNGRECQLRSFAGSWAYGVNPNADNLQAAMALAAWLGSPDMQGLQYEYSGGNTLPCSMTLLSSGLYYSDPVAAAQHDTIANTAYLQPTVPEMVTYWSNADSMGRALVNGQINASNAFQKTEEWNYSLNGG